MRSCAFVGAALTVLSLCAFPDHAAGQGGQTPADAGGSRAGVLTIRSPLSGQITAAYRISVRSYADADRNLSGYRTFAFEYRSKDNPLLEKELSRQLQTVMEAKGLKRQEADPQMVAQLDFTVQPAANDLVSRYLQVNFLDGAEMRSGKELKVPPVIWKGEAASAGTEGDIRTVAPFMFGEMMTEFPAKSGRSELRAVYCQDVGETGIDIDRNDWHVIRAVRPGSPAALAGLTVADRLEKIDDGAVSWRMTYRPEKEKYPFKRAHYVEGNYLYIRWFESAGNTMVLKVKSGDGKTRTVRVALAIVNPCVPPR